MQVGKTCFYKKSRKNSKRTKKTAAQQRPSRFLAELSESMYAD